MKYAIFSYSKTLYGLLAGALVVAFLALGTFFNTASAAENVLIRGVVKPGGGDSTINLFITHVAKASKPSELQGERVQVNLSKAKKLKWIVQDGKLRKVSTTANPVAEKEVVISGTRSGNGAITAKWSVQNYREFHVEGVVQGRELDKDSGTEGMLTVQVSKVVMRGVSPERKFKESQFLNKDMVIRVNGATKLMAIGNDADWKAVKYQTGANLTSKIDMDLNEVRQDARIPVVIEGQLTDESDWTASKYWQRNR